MPDLLATNVAQHDPALTLDADLKHERRGSSIVDVPPFFDGTGTMQVDYLDDENGPTEEELATLPRTAGKVNFAAYTIAFVELCERFSFYGTTVVSVIPLEEALAMLNSSPGVHQLHQEPQGHS